VVTVPAELLGTSLTPMSTRAKRYVSLDRDPEPEVRSSDSVSTCPSGETLPRPSPHVTSRASSILPPEDAATNTSRTASSTQALLELALNAIFVRRRRFSKSSCTMVLLVRRLFEGVMRARV
jgi:hypothetical protein